MRKLALTLIAGCLSLSCCQPAPEESATAPRQTAVLDYTLLGIWPERFQVHEMTTALGEAGIHTKLSGYQPCLVNVETAKLYQAHSIIQANPAWVEGAQINPPVFDVITLTPAVTPRR